jgi:hypothetical protein
VITPLYDVIVLSLLMKKPCAIRWVGIYVVDTGVEPGPPPWDVDD